MMMVSKFLTRFVVLGKGVLNVSNLMFRTLEMLKFKFSSGDILNQKVKND